MDLTGQLSNLSAALVNVLALPLRQRSDRTCKATCRQPILPQRRYEVLRDAVVSELTGEDYGLRLREIRRRVEARLGEPVACARFKDYVNDQSKGANPLLERLGYGMYRLARE